MNSKIILKGLEPAHIRAVATVIGITQVTTVPSYFKAAKALPYAMIIYFKYAKYNHP
jgi:hypothetical protein